MNHKKTIFSIIFLLFFTVGCSIGLFSPTINNSNGNFTTPKASAGEITIITPENKTYTQPDNGYYPATYGFENDLDASIPQEWVDNSQSGCTARVASEKTGHRKVVHLDDDSGNKIYFDHYFPAQTYGTIELWVLAEDATHGFAIRTFGTNGSYDPYIGAHMVYIGFGANDKWSYTDSAGATTIIPTYDGVYDPIDNTWYHLTIHFRCNNSPNFMGLNENSYKILVDGIESVELEASFGNVMNSVDRFDIATTAATTTDGWVDAISFSWDEGYTIGDNMNEGLLLSFHNTTNLDWKGYSIDEFPYKTILGNKAIPMPSNGFHNVQVFGNNTIGSEYASNLRWFSVDTSPFVNILNPENKTYRSPDLGQYPSTYNFEDEIEGTSGTAINFVDLDNSGSGCSISIETLSDDHHKVIKLEDTSGTYNVDAYNIFGSAISNGTIEFYMYDSDASDGLYAQLWDSTSPLACSGFRIYGDAFHIYTSPDWVVIPGAPAAKDNTWYHIRMDFECTSGGYQGLSQYDYYVWINGTQYGPFDFGNNYQPDRIRLPTSSGHSNYYGYFDAISYSWDPSYYVGDNLHKGLLLSYESNFEMNWTAYSLDGLSNRTILGDAVIPMPSDGVHQVVVYGNTSIGNIIKSNVRWFSVDTSPYIDIISPENKTYIEPMVGYYPASYGFENDAVGSNPKDWVIWNEGDIIEVIDEIDGHKNILRLYDSSTSTDNHVQKEYEAIDHGQTEFWMRTTDSYDHQVFSMKTSSDVTLFEVGFLQNDFYTYDSSGNTILSSANNNQWYHVRVVFRASYGITYEDLANQFICKVYIDGAEFGPFNFVETLDPEWFRFVTANVGASNVNFYIDAVGFSWDPYYEVGDNANEGLLLSYDSNFEINSTKFSLDHVANRTISGNITIPMPSDGLHNVQVFANDSSGQICASELRYFITNALGPSITINSPTFNSFAGSVAPSFILTIPDDDLYNTWYSLDGGTTNIPFTGLSGAIDQTEWNTVGNGTTTIIFYANDTANNIAQAEVTLRKDIIEPVISIITPNTGAEFDYTPIFEISIAEGNLDEYWYTIDDGAHNYTITDLAGTINQNAWNLAPSGPVTIRFYACDLAGNIGTSSVIVAKTSEQQQPPPAIPGYNLFFIIGVISVISTLIFRKRSKS